MNSKFRISLLLTLLASAVLLPASAVGQIKPDLAGVAAAEHRTHRLPRPTDYADFGSLEEWIKANYTTYLVPDSLKHRMQDDGRDSISFMTVGEDGVYNHHILVEDAAGSFVLQTTDSAEVPDEDSGRLIGAAEGGIKAFSAMAAVASGSSCATGTTSGTANKCDCVFYARCLVPSYPRPATYYTEKLKTINWPFPSLPWYGYVAVMNTGAPYGHVGVVNGIGLDAHWNLIVMLNEANYSPCQVTTTRNGTPSQLHIAGYYHP